MSTANQAGSAQTAGPTGERPVRLSASHGVPAGGWLRALRQGSGVTQNALAAKLGFKRQAWAQFEASEARGAISLASLRRAADVLGCDLVYSLVPRNDPADRRSPSPADHRPPGSPSVGGSGEGMDSVVKYAPAVPPVEAVAPAAWVEPELPTELK